MSEMSKANLLAAFGEIQQRTFVVADADETHAIGNVAEKAMLREVLALLKTGPLSDYKTLLHNLVDEITDNDVQRVVQRTTQMARPDILNPY